MAQQRVSRCEQVALRQRGNCLSVERRSAQPTSTCAATQHRHSHERDLQLVLGVRWVVDGAVLDAAAGSCHGADDLPDVVHLTQAHLPARDVADDAGGRLLQV